jgi:hypothetical protein
MALQKGLVFTSHRLGSVVLDFAHHIESVGFSSRYPRFGALRISLKFLGELLADSSMHRTRNMAVLK